MLNNKNLKIVIGATLSVLVMIVLILSFVLVEKNKQLKLSDNIRRSAVGLSNNDSEVNGFSSNIYDEDSYCYEEDNVSGITLTGDLYTYAVESTDEDAEYYTSTGSEDIVYYINEAENDPYMKAIILEIDSWGGEATAGKEVADALKRAQKPTVAVIREAGTSAAYWAATGADVIFANTTSNVGSIGVTMSYLDYSRQNDKDGLIYQQISSGKFKDTGDPDKSLNWEEKQLLQRDTDLLNEIFISEVALNRDIEVGEVEKLADGSSMLGQMALDNGLIDRLGGEYEVKEYLEELLGENVSVCW